MVNNLSYFGRLSASFMVQVFTNLMKPSEKKRSSELLKVGGSPLTTFGDDINHKLTLQYFHVLTGMSICIKCFG